MYSVTELVQEYRKVEQGWNNRELTLPQVVSRLTGIETRAKLSGVFEEMMATLKKEDAERRCV